MMMMILQWQSKFYEASTSIEPQTILGFIHFRIVVVFMS
jgi:hypothetical protein